jgi:hypothetical protein
MPDYKLEIEGMSIVVLGSFNPSIFQPHWFSYNNLIPPQEARASKVEIIHPNATVFSSDWFTLKVTEFNFMLETYDAAKTLPLRDLVLGTFKILEHTPVTALGMNKQQHYQAPSEDSWHAFGHLLAPKSAWAEILLQPGMRLLIMEGKRQDCNATIVRVQAEPSARVQPGVFLSVNQHYDLLKICRDKKGVQLTQPQSSAQALDSEEPAPADRMRLLLSTLESSWDNFLVYSAQVAPHLFASLQTKKKKD